MMKRAFTLIELLTVMAITAVLLTLIVLPIFQSFQILRSAQAFADAQDRGRILTERIAREVGNAVSVRDAASTMAIIPGSTVAIELPYTKLDLIPPATGSPEPGLAPGVYRDPVTGKIDPTMTRPKGDINLNVVPGATLVRWWVGLRDPSKNYNEPYTGLLMARNGDRDNLYVLRRAEVQPFVYRVRKDGQGTASWRPNLAYFHSDDKDPNAPTTQDFDTRIIDLDDPYFFVADGKYLPEGMKDDPANRVNDPEKNNRVLRWAGIEVSAQSSGIGAGNAVSRSVAIQTEISRYDMIRPMLAGSPPKVVNDPLTGRPSVIPLVQFRPTRVAAEPASGSAAARPGQAVEGIDQIGPDTYKTSRGLWTHAIVRHYPGGFAPGTSSLQVANVDELGGVAINTGASNGSGLDTIAPNPNNYVLFDLKTYEQYLSRGQTYPFTAACLSAGATDVLPGYPGTPWYNMQDQRILFTPFRVLTATGTIRTSFAIEEVGTKPLASGGPNLPYVDIKVAGTTPAQDQGVNILTPLTPNATEANRDPGYDPNRAYNYVFNKYPELQGVLQRFIDLRMLANEDGTLSPLNPFAPSTTGAMTGFTIPSQIGSGDPNRVRIVPGSDEVYAPDQTPGPNYGNSVRYTRVTGEPGPNQYRLVYADLAEPSDGNGNVSPLIYKSLLGLSDDVMNSGAPFTTNGYNGANVVSAAIQARYKAGYLQFDSDPNVPLPKGRITVKYRFQLNGPRDTFAVDLDTREIMQILLTIKNYPQSSAPNAQTITLKSTATLRNALR